MTPYWKGTHALSIGKTSNGVRCLSFFFTTMSFAFRMGLDTFSINFNIIAL